MKFDRYRFLAVSVFTFLMVLNSCTKEPLTEPDASFTMENTEDLKAGASVTFTFTGAGDFITIFSGDTLEEYQYYPVNKGSVVSNMTYNKTYNSQGTYIVTAVASSYGSWATENSRNVIEKEIYITDSRTKMTDFSIKSIDVEGLINDDDHTINWSMSSLVDRSKLVASFITSSSDAIVYVDDVVQVSNESPNDFTDAVTYLVEAPDGTTQTYSTNITFFYPSDKKELLTFNIATTDAVVSINEESKTVAVWVPAGTDLSRIRATATSSLLSSVAMQGKTLDAERTKTVDLSVNPTIVTVTAEDLTTQDYEITTTMGE